MESSLLVGSKGLSLGGGGVIKMSESGLAKVVESKLLG